MIKEKGFLSIDVEFIDRDKDDMFDRIASAVFWNVDANLDRMLTDMYGEKYVEAMDAFRYRFAIALTVLIAEMEEMGD